MSCRCRNKDLYQHDSITRALRTATATGFYVAVVSVESNGKETEKNYDK